MPHYTEHVIILGGGASGVMMAAHLLRDRPEGMRVTLIEKQDRIGRGLAFATEHPAHLLNVSAANMSAFPDEPGHFWSWLLARQIAPSRQCPDRFAFAPRALYALYLENLLAPHLPRNGGEGPFIRVFGEAQSVKTTRNAVEVLLADGSVQRGDRLVLACGYDPDSAANSAANAALCRLSLSDVSPDATVVLLGTGLTMVDCVMALLDADHRGRIVALSRRGLLPQEHRAAGPLTFDAADVPFGTSLAYLCRWLRTQTREQIANGGDWRSVLDALRPHTQTLWRYLPPQSRARFLRHALPWWTSHRHRMAPQIHTRVQAAVAHGQLQVMAAKVLHLTAASAGSSVIYRRRGRKEAERIEAARVVDCTGFLRDPLATRNPVLQNLFACGLARPDPLGIGFEIARNCALVDASGRPSRRIFAIGPLTRSAFWEITAIPDIRVQVARLAADWVAAHRGEPVDASP